MEQLTQSTQTDDFLDNPQLHAITASTPEQSPEIPVLRISLEENRRATPESPGNNISLEVEMSHKNCFKCRCKMKFKHILQHCGTGSVGAAIATIIILLL